MPSRLASSFATYYMLYAFEAGYLLYYIPSRPAIINNNLRHNYSLTLLLSIYARKIYNFRSLRRILYRRNILVYIYKYYFARVDIGFGSYYG